MAIGTETTSFSKDILGRYIGNTFEEAMASCDRSVRPDARPFDIVIVGGGSFGGVLAHHMFMIDKARRHRILVLEGGPVTIGEHVQNIPMVGLGVPGPTSIAEMRQRGVAHLPREQVWGLAWHSPTPFTGLAYCVGGRSMYWGGWAPEPLPDELGEPFWPQNVVDELNGPKGYHAYAQRQLGVDETNDFIYGPLHVALRKCLYDAVAGKRVPGAVTLSDLPDHPAARKASGAPALADLLGLGESGRKRREDELRDEMKLEAPLAVQARNRPGFFPANKFSVGPLLVQAARSAFAESNGDDVRKRLMIVPHCHVTRLSVADGRVTAVHTSNGTVPIAQGGAVVLALGTIESTRLALESFGGLPGSGRIGHGLTAHLRSNLTIRVPREALEVSPAVKELQASALFLKGRHIGKDGRERFFHLQITAAGLGPQGADSEAELWKKIPDVDTYDRFAGASDSHVVVTLRGIGEMDGDNAANRVVLDPEPDEYGVRRAFVTLSASEHDKDLWNAMDVAADDVARALGGDKGFEVLVHGSWRAVPPGGDATTVLPHAGRRDKLGSTHHEAGTLRIGTDPATSVTDPNARFHAALNAYAVGPALVPRAGSPNPMLTGVALARRLAEHLTDRKPYVAPDGYTVLFDGMDTSRWRLAGRGDFHVVNGSLQAQPGDGLGLSWFADPTPPDFSLRLQFQLTTPHDNSGVFVRFPHPDSMGYDNTAWVAVNHGFEVQIDELARPDGADMHRTGSIYGQKDQSYKRPALRPVGEWNDLQIDVRGQEYQVTVNGVVSTTFTNTDPNRGRPSAAGAPAFIGLQAHTGYVRFRRMRIKPL